MRLKIIPNPDKAMYDEMTLAVKENDGYCPCLMEKNEDTKCMCLAFRNSKPTKENPSIMCHCGRFVKIKIDE